MNKIIFTILFVVITSFVITSFHLLYTADTIAEVFGYFVSVAVLPTLVGCFIGMISIFMLRKQILRSIKELWWLPTIGAVTSLSLVGYTVLIMSLPEN